LVEREYSILKKRLLNWKKENIELEKREH